MRKRRRDVCAEMIEHAAPGAFELAERERRAAVPLAIGWTAA